MAFDDLDALLDIVQRDGTDAILARKRIREMFDPSITLSIVRRADGTPEQVATFVFSDLAETAAAAICERMRYPVIVTNVQENGDFSARFEMGMKSVSAVTMVKL